MRNEKTSWNRSYKGPQHDIQEEVREERKQQRRERQRTAKQRYSAAFWDKHFEVNHGQGAKYPSRPPEADLAVGDRRKKVDAHAERKRLRMDLREVWDE